MKRLGLFFVGLIVGGLLSCGLAYAQDSTVNMKGQPVNPAMAPSVIPSNNRFNCTTGLAGSVSTAVVGVAIGSAFTEVDCQTGVRAQQVHEFGLTVAAVAYLCLKDDTLQEAMLLAGSPCPAPFGTVSDDAFSYWKLYPKTKVIFEKYEKAIPKKPADSELVPLNAE